MINVATEQGCWLDRLMTRGPSPSKKNPTLVDLFTQSPARYAVGLSLLVAEYDEFERIA